MTSTPAILWETFGLIGLTSAVGWACAAVLLVAGIGRRRWNRWLAAAIAAAAGLALAGATSESIRSIEVDRSAEVTAAEAVAAKATQEKLRGRAAGIRFAEDTATDQADVAGVTVAEEQGAYERAVEEQLEKIPAYRSRGKKSRSQGTPAEKKKENEKKEENEKQTTKESGKDKGGEDTAAAGDAGLEPNVRKLPESQLIVADRFARGNQAIAWTVFACAVGLVGMEYVRRFNSTFAPVWPVPLAGTPIDGLTGKEHVVSLPPGGVDAVPAWIDSLVRRGESFILFAANDPFAGRSVLPRMSLPEVSLRRISLPPVQITTPVRTFPARALATDPSLVELAFESAWFGRGCTVIVGADAAGDVLTRFAAAVESRRRCRAAASRTLDIIWALDAAPPPEAAATLARLAAPTNIRWSRP